VSRASRDPRARPELRDQRDLPATVERTEGLDLLEPPEDRVMLASRVQLENKEQQVKLVTRASPARMRTTAHAHRVVEVELHLLERHLVVLQVPKLVDMLEALKLAEHHLVVLQVLKLVDMLEALKLAERQLLLELHLVVLLVLKLTELRRAAAVKQLVVHLLEADPVQDLVLLLRHLQLRLQLPPAVARLAKNMMVELLHPLLRQLLLQLLHLKLRLHLCLQLPPVSRVKVAAHMAAEDERVSQHKSIE